MNSTYKDFLFFRDFRESGQQLKARYTIFENFLSNFVFKFEFQPGISDFLVEWKAPLKKKWILICCIPYISAQMQTVICVQMSLLFLI